MEDSSSEDFDDINEDFDELSEIKDRIHIYLSSLGYITQISQSSFFPDELTVSVHGNNLMHSITFVQFVIRIIKTKPNSGMTYRFYSQFFVDPKNGKKIHVCDEEINYRYMFGALTVDKLMNHIKKGINMVEQDSLKNKFSNFH